MFVDQMTGLKEEINECIMMPGMCKHGTCVNTLGSFHCECDRGYNYDEASHSCLGQYCAVCTVQVSVNITTF